MPVGIKGFQKSNLNYSRIKGPWNKGKKGSQTSWNKGMNKEDMQLWREYCIARKSEPHVHALKGRPKSPEHIKHLSEANKGRSHPMSIETKIKIGRKNRTRWEKYHELHPKPVKVKTKFVRECICSKCNQRFSSHQYNPKRIPKICPSCRTEKKPCKMCGKLIKYNTTYCSTRCAQIDPTNEKVKYGHIVQGLMVSGKYNRMANPIFKEKQRQRT